MKIFINDKIIVGFFWLQQSICHLNYCVPSSKLSRLSNQQIMNDGNYKKNSVNITMFFYVN